MRTTLGAIPMTNYGREKLYEELKSKSKIVLGKGNNTKTIKFIADSEDGDIKNTVISLHDLARSIYEAKKKFSHNIYSGKIPEKQASKIVSTGDQYIEVKSSFYSEEEREIRLDKQRRHEYTY